LVCFYLDIISRRLGTRSISDLGGIAKNAPKFATAFFNYSAGYRCAAIDQRVYWRVFIAEQRFSMERMDGKCRRPDHDIWCGLYAAHV